MNINGLNYLSIPICGSKVGYDMDDLKVCFHILVVSEYHKSSQ